MSQTPQAGWYPDPAAQGMERYWDGAAWTEQQRPSQPAQPWSTPAQQQYGQQQYGQQQYGQQQWGQTQPQFYGHTQGIGGQAVDKTRALVFAILTFFCCLPLAIPSLIFALKIDNLNAVGDYAGAEEANRKARLFSWIGIGLGLAFTVLQVVMVVLAGTADVPTTPTAP